MRAKQPVPAPTEPTNDKGRFWQPPEKRNVISEEGRKWQEENAEAIASMNEWVEKNGLPLAKYRVW
jgi:hypothetical protein